MWGNVENLVMSLFPNQFEQFMATVKAEAFGLPAHLVPEYERLIRQVLTWLICAPHSLKGV